MLMCTHIHTYLHKYPHACVVFILDSALEQGTLILKNRERMAFQISDKSASLLCNDIKWTCRETTSGIEYWKLFRCNRVPEWVTVTQTWEMILILPFKKQMSEYIITHHKKNMVRLAE